MKKWVAMVLSQTVDGWDPQLRPGVRVFLYATLVGAGVWVGFKLFIPTYSYFGDKVLGLAAVSVVLMALGYIFKKYDEGPAPTALPGEDTLTCSDCGSHMIENGALWKCLNCGKSFTWR